MAPPPERDTCPEASTLALTYLSSPGLTLDDLTTLGVPRWAARNLLTYRNGPDGQWATADDRPIDALSLLDDPFFGGPSTAALIEEAVRVTCTVPDLMPPPPPESPETGEPSEIEGTVESGGVWTEAPPIDPEALPGPPALVRMRIEGINVIALTFDKPIRLGDVLWTPELWAQSFELGVFPDGIVRDGGIPWPILTAWQLEDTPEQVVIITDEAIPEDATVQVRAVGDGLPFDPEFDGAGMSDNPLPAQPTLAFDLQEQQPGWTLYPPSVDDSPGWAWTPEGLLSIGGVDEELTVEAVAPFATASQNIKVSVVFRVLADDTPYNRFAFPRVNLRAVNDFRWLGCYIRNDQSRLQPGVPPDNLTPSLNCVYQNRPGRDRNYFEGCRYQFYVDEAQGGTRYDWLTFAADTHRMEVVVVGNRLRASLYNLDRPPEDGGPVAVVDVPDIDVDGDPPHIGMAGLGGFDSGRALFTRFTVEPASEADLPPLDARWAPLEVCP